MLRLGIHGGKWWKFDFHTHTPASHDYKTSLVSERDWLLKFMTKEIDCVAITDHNSGLWIDKLKNELKILKEEQPEGYRDLFLFPGVELSVNGGIHLLAIFDPEKGTNDISSLLGSVGYNGQHGQTDTCTEKPFEKVVEEISKFGGIAIPAHVDKDCGLLKVQGVSNLGPTLRRNLQQSSLLAIELSDPLYVKPQIFLDLGTQLSEVIGSDSHNLDMIGDRFTWIKMEYPNFEALRLSLHDGDDGVIRYDKCSGDPNNLSNRFYIKNITVKDGQKAGRGSPLNVNFSPWFTALIGGRGSGKSSIFSYLRIALDKSKDLTEDFSEDFKKFFQVGSRQRPGMLTENTSITVLIHKDNRDIEIRWNKDGWTEFHFDENNNPINKGNPGDMEVRFPIRIFSQKQLFEITRDPTMILQLIDSQFDKRTWQDSLYILESDWMGLRKQLRDSNRLLSSMASYEKELNDLDVKIKVYERSGHKDLLEKYSKTKTTASKLENLTQKIKSCSDSYGLLTSQLPELPLPPELDLESKTKLDSILLDYHNIISAIKKNTEELSEIEEKLKKSFEKIPFFEEHTKYQISYEGLVKQLKDAGEKDPYGYENLVKAKNELEEKYKTRKKQEDLNKGLREKVSAKIFEIEKHQKNLRNSRLSILKIWNGSVVGNSLRINLISFGDIEKSEISLRQTIRKTGNEFARDIYIAAEDAGSYEGLLGSLKNNIEGELGIDKGADLRRELIKELAGKHDNKKIGKKLQAHMEQLRQNNPEDIDRLAIWFPEDLITMSLIRDGRPKDIESGSAGERTAAVLALLLSMSGGPLLIDQPEDDLDTRLISDLVVEGIRKLKLNQQIVVVTHNPNIPVNAGAENIVELRYAQGQILSGSAGGLQKHEVRLAVCDIMEGGRAALDKRYYRVAQALKDSKNGVG